MFGLAVITLLDHRVLHVPVGPGLTALYGLNGSGKTRLLNRLLVAFLPGESPGDDLNRLLYQRGMVQTDLPVGPGTLELEIGDEVTRWVAALVGFELPTTEEEDDPFGPLMPVARTGDEVWEALLTVTASALVRVGAAHHAEGLLAEGTWLLAPTWENCDVYLGTRDRALLDSLPEGPRPRWERDFREGRRAEGWSQMIDALEDERSGGALPMLPRGGRPGCVRGGRCPAHPPRRPRFQPVRGGDRTCRGRKPRLRPAGMARRDRRSGRRRPADTGRAIRTTLTTSWAGPSKCRAPG